MSNSGHLLSGSAPGGVWRTAIVGLGLIILSGVAYRMTATRLDRGSEGTPLPPGTLAALSNEIGPWRGRDVPMDKEVVRATDTDDLLNRGYARTGSFDRVGLYVAYGGRVRDLAPHRPQVCYPGAGWTSEGIENVDLELEDGRTLPCQIHHFGRGGLSAQRILVLSCYLIDGRFGRDISMVRSLAWQFNSGRTHMAQMQVMCEVGRSTAHSESLIREFAMLAAPRIDQVLARAIADQRDDNPREGRGSAARPPDARGQAPRDQSGDRASQESTP